jgi:hypothetical protein
MRKMNGYKVAVPMVVGLALAMGMLWDVGERGRRRRRRSGWHGWR